jgi:hypothetical protein
MDRPIVNRNGPSKTILAARTCPALSSRKCAE